MKRHSIRTIMSKHFLILAAAILFVVSLFYSILQYRTLKEHAVGNLTAGCETTAVSMTQGLNEMDTILLYSIASSEMKDAFLDYSRSQPPFQHNQARAKLASSLIWLKGFNFDVLQLNVYGMEENGYGVGGYNGELHLNTKEAEWYEETFSRSGKSCIMAPEEDMLVSGSSGLDEDTLYISLYRMFYNEFHVPVGFIGVKERYDRFFDKVIASNELYTPEVAIYDAGGKQLYPKEETFNYLEKRDDVGKGGEIKNTLTGKKQYLTFSDVKDYGIVVAMAVDRRDFMAPVYRNLYRSLLAVFAAFVFCLMIASALSKKLTDPLSRIYSFLSDRDKSGFERIELADTGITEIDTLRDSLNENISYQETTTRTLLTLKEQEVQAQMLALQAQMNPHFLYNSLSTISEMADEGMTEEVSGMCRDITSILRYISSNREQRIRVEEEMEQVDIYLNIMKRRFGEDLCYRYEIEDEILDCMVPKLCIQLLVENAVKSVTKGLPPWEITVKGGRNGDDWYVTVSDNGAGFDPEVDRYLRSCMDDILETGTLPSLGIKGMGILNIFIRLYLLDGIPFVFDFGNKKEGGAFVTVGGHVHEKAETDLFLKPEEFPGTVS
ncbi:MAG: histidine kinase [Lachnospiraceae bacterium]|nr:histidine kinase [Lachnospiraceae bacterium]